jgi:hypothetical protein
MGIFDLFRKRETEKKEIPTNTIIYTARYELCFKENISPNEKKIELQECYNFNKCIICAELLKLDKVYSRSEIETMSGHLGYSVFDNPGGATNKKGYPTCACKWKSVLAAKYE